MAKLIPEVVKRLTEEEVREVAEYYYSDTIFTSYDQEIMEHQLRQNWSKEEWMKIKELACDNYEDDWSIAVDAVWSAADELGLLSEDGEE